MKRMQITFILICGLLASACHHAPPEPTTPAPPATTYRLESVTLSLNGSSNSIRAAFVTPEFIKAVKVSPAVGRYFSDEEFQNKAHDIAVMSHGLWRRRFGSDPQVVGRTLELNGKACTVVGIMPKGFNAPERTEIWLPEAASGH